MFAVVALLGVAAALVLLKLLGQAMPAVPPGLVLVVAAAVLMLAVPRRWTGALGVLAGIAEALGVLLGSGVSGLFPPADGASAGAAILVVTWMRLAASLVAVVASLHFLVHRRRQHNEGVDREGHS